MKKQRRFKHLLLAASGLLAACSSPVVLHAPNYNQAVIYKACPLDSLLQGSLRFAGAPVEVQGVFHYNFENVSLSANAATSDSDKALYLQFVPTVFRHATRGTATDSLELCNGKKVTVRGRFSTARGHLGQYPGTIEDIVFLACQ